MQRDPAGLYAPLTSGQPFQKAEVTVVILVTGPNVSTFSLRLVDMVNFQREMKKVSKQQICTSQNSTMGQVRKKAHVCLSYPKMCCVGVKIPLSKPCSPKVAHIVLRTAICVCNTLQQRSNTSDACRDKQVQAAAVREGQSDESQLASHKHNTHAAISACQSRSALRPQAQQGAH